MEHVDPASGVHAPSGPALASESDPLTTLTSRLASMSARILGTEVANAAQPDPAPAPAVPAPAMAPVPVPDVMVQTVAPTVAILNPEEPCAICMADPTLESQFPAFPALCGHAFCETCTTACLNRSLKCPMCRAEAPESSKPPPDRRTIMLTLYQRIRIAELERLQEEQDARQRARRPRTRIGKWFDRVSRRLNALLDDLLGIDD